MAPSAPPLAPAVQPARIDKSLLPLAEAKRIRDKAHLKFVASQPCLVCSRQLHQAGNEELWRKPFKIESLAVAKGLWEQMPPKSVATVETQNSGAAENPTDAQASGDASQARVEY